MKKLLLTLLTVVLSVSSSWADSWEKCSITELTSTDVFVIVDANVGKAMTNNNGTSSAPAATSVTVSQDGNTISGVTDAMKWNISGNATDGYTFYPNGSTTTWLYCTATNNGVRVGTNDNKLFEIANHTNDEPFLKNKETERYVGVYNSSDWRCYTSINSNINATKTRFYKFVAGATINVTGVTLNKNTTSIEVEAKETLTATVAPANATNKDVTWTSDNEDVATVENGVVTGIAAGTATITVTTNDGNYSASCVVTVTEPVLPEMAKLCTLVFKEYDSTTGDSNTKYTTSVSDVFSSGDEYVNSVSGISNCYPARQGRGAKFGTSNNPGSITITLAGGQKAIGVILNASGYANGEINAITVNGISKTPKKYATQGFEDLTYIFTEATNTITIATAAKRGYVKSIDVMVEAEVVTVNSCGNASFSCDKALDFTNVDGVAAYMVTAETAENVTLTQINKVPANTGIFVIGTAGSYDVPVLVGDADDASANKLVATTTPYAVTGSDNVWALSKTDGLLHPVSSGTIAAGKAYLVSNVGGSARALVLDNESTGIQSVQQNAQNGVAYNLAGQRVAADAKGIVIMNGKKYLNK